jgi:hypothetical protein
LDFSKGTNSAGKFSRSPKDKTDPVSSTFILFKILDDAHSSQNPVFLNNDIAEYGNTCTASDLYNYVKKPQDLQ